MKTTGSVSNFYGAIAFSIIALAMISSVVLFGRTSRSYHESEFLQIGANRIARGIELINTYEGEAATKLTFPAEYNITVDDRGTIKIKSKGNKVRSEYSSIKEVKIKNKGEAESIVTFDSTSTICIKKIKQDGNYRIKIEGGDLLCTTRGE